MIPRGLKVLGGNASSIYHTIYTQEKKSRWDADERCASSAIRSVNMARINTSESEPLTVNLAKADAKNALIIWELLIPKGIYILIPKSNGWIPSQG